MKGKGLPEVNWRLASDLRQLGSRFGALTQRLQCAVVLCRAQGYSGAVLGLPHHFQDCALPLNESACLCAFLQLSPLKAVPPAGMGVDPPHIRVWWSKKLHSLHSPTGHRRWRF